MYGCVPPHAELRLSPRHVSVRFYLSVLELPLGGWHQTCPPVDTSIGESACATHAHGRRDGLADWRYIWRMCGALWLTPAKPLTRLEIYCNQDLRYGTPRRTILAFGIPYAWLRDHRIRRASPRRDPDHWEPREGPGDTWVSPWTPDPQHIRLALSEAIVPGSPTRSPQSPDRHSLARGGREG